MAYDFEKERNEAIAAGERALTSLRGKGGTSLCRKLGSG